MNRKMLSLFSALFLMSVPTLSHADYCSDIKERYWKCARASMVGESCDSADDVSIPSECLTAGSEKTPKQAEPSTAPPTFFKGKKESKSFVYKPEVTPKKSVKIVNIKPKNHKIYFETEEEVEQFTTKIHDDLLNAIKEGKRVRLQFE
jgi:hypothetical protein